MDVAPVIRNGRTCLPARYVAEAFGNNVYRSPKRRKVLVAPDNDVFQTICEDIIAAENENLQASPASIDPDSPFYQVTGDLLNLTFETYDLEYEIAKAEILELSGSVETVRVVQVTRKVSGSLFRDNRTTALQYFRKAADGKWKSYNSKVERFEYLD